MRYYFGLLAVVFSFHAMAQTSLENVPQYETYHGVVPSVQSASQSTQEVLIHHFSNHTYPSIVYVNNSDEWVHVVHQSAPFEFDSTSVPNLPLRDYRAIEVGQEMDGVIDWFFFSVEPAQVTKKHGLFDSGPGEVLFASELDLINMAVVDVTGDGEQEVITIENGNESPMLMWGDVNGEFAILDTIGFSRYAENVYAEDLNYDGISDFIVSGSPLRMYTSVSESEWVVSHNEPGRKEAVFGDLDGDGDLDVATTDYYGQSWSQILNELNGDFASESAVADPESDQWYGETIDAADVTGDGRIDLLLTRAINNTIYLYRSGMDAMDVLIELSPAGNTGNKHVALVDMDLDGDLDWLGAGPYTHIGVLENHQIHQGCTYVDAQNYLSTANVDDGTCVFSDQPSCSSCPHDSDFDGLIGATDLLDLLSFFGMPCADNFSCGDLVSFDGHDYATVQIGASCWFAENLQNDQYANGDPILGNLSDEEWIAATDGAQAVYDGLVDNLVEYGRLYNLHAAMDQRGLCPSGWHVPADAEWDDLVEALGGVDYAGVAMKNSATETPVWNGTNSSGFSGAPGGYRDAYNGLYTNNNRGWWWTTSAYGCGGWHRALASDYDELLLSSWCSEAGFSIRCTRDSE